MEKRKERIEREVDRVWCLTMYSTGWARKYVRDLYYFLQRRVFERRPELANRKWERYERVRPHGPNLIELSPTKRPTLSDQPTTEALSQIQQPIDESNGRQSAVPLFKAVRPFSLRATIKSSFEVHEDLNDLLLSVLCSCCSRESGLSTAKRTKRQPCLGCHF